jgi:hypothetical protein
MRGSQPGKAGLLPGSHAPKERLNGLVQAEVDLRLEFAIDQVDGWVVLPAFGQRLLVALPVPALTCAQPHDPPVVEAAALALHHFQRGGILLADDQADFHGFEHACS